MMIPAMTKRQQLIKLLAERSVQHGRFTLASGMASDIYVDARITTMSPEGLALIGPLAIEAVRAAGWMLDAIGGLTLGADPIAYSMSYTSNSMPPLLRAFSVRKEPKTHGTSQLIEGPFHDRDRVAVIEDVITTGASALRAIDAVQSRGGIIKGVLALVDREVGGRKTIENAGYSVVSLIRIGEITALIPGLDENQDFADA
jgi:orotate phosphoribosyltransferase